MKKTLLTLCLAAVTAFSFAQENAKESEEKVTGKNEIRFNLLNTIIGIPEISYERMFNDNTGAGISVLARIYDDLDYNFGVIPYYRIYFGNAKRASGFFIEANAAFMQLDDDKYYIWTDGKGNWSSVPSDKTVSSFGIGAAAGGKFLTKSGFVGEAYFGLGRLFNKNAGSEAYPRIGITIGKRF
ncbi:hypothetical protein [Pedobacter nanyangensis]|uniref:hypothetical protein n=1 Tax=Pedobacter nanyangensis TaxID=1562389 RepID=UPI000DE31A42|nr:hypothetical protein [Pedobacter nanyangensis]